MRILPFQLCLLRVIALLRLGVPQQQSTRISFSFMLGVVTAVCCVPHWIFPVFMVTTLSAQLQQIFIPLASWVQPSRELNGAPPKRLPTDGPSVPARSPESMRIPAAHPTSAFVHHQVQL
jgi:hypothetical protein